MIHGTRSRSTRPSRAGRRRFATIAGWCSLFLLIAAFAAMPLAVSAHDGGKGRDDRTAEMEKHGNDGTNHDAKDDRGKDGANHDANDDRGKDAQNHDANDDRGNDGPNHDVNDDRGVDAQRFVLAPVPMPAPLDDRR